MHLPLLIILQLLKKSAVIVSGQDAANASLRDNWDDTDGYYRKSLRFTFELLHINAG